MKYLELYKELMKTGKIPPNGLYPYRGGLCSLIDRISLDPLMPKGGDWNDLYNKGFSTAYWGAGVGYGLGVVWDFTPLRQNIVLFLAAMNGELD